MSHSHRTATHHVVQKLRYPVKVWGVDYIGLKAVPIGHPGEEILLLVDSERPRVGEGKTVAVKVLLDLQVKEGLPAVIATIN